MRSEILEANRRFDSLAATVLVLAGISAFVFVASWLGIALTSQGGRVASLWFANAGALAVLLRPGGHKSAVTAAVALANVTANLVAGDSLVNAIGLTACNIIEITLAAAILGRFHLLAPDDEWRGLLPRVLLFIAVACVGAPAVSAVCAATFLAIASQASMLDVAVRWFLADSLGMLTVGPPLVLLFTGRFNREWSAWHVLETLAWAGVAIAATFLIFNQGTKPALFLLFPCLLLVASRVRFVSASLIITLVSAVAVLLTVSGQGPIASALPDMAGRIAFLQLFLTVAALTTLVISALTFDRANLMAELVVARDRANEAAKAKSAFLATMSHEIRTPMTGVLGMIELLRTDPGERDRARFFANMQQSANLLMTVLDDILDFSKLESGAIVLEEIDFDMRHLARATIDLFDGAASGKGLVLALDFAAPFSAVRGDPVRLQQVMANLVSNAIKFTQVGRIDLTIDAVPAGDGAHAWTFHIRDTGMGIAQDQIDRLFSPFVQADASTTRKFGGTGLGLAISRRLVEAMGGKLEVISTPGLGSAFSYTVVLAEGVPIAAMKQDAAAAGPARPLDVLLAEDNPVNRLLIGTLVRRMGHTVTAVENGRLAVDAVAGRHFDVVLMDMQMPEMDGLAATRAIRATAAGADLPIIALTADASPDRRNFYENVGLTDFLTKPIDAARLEMRLAALGARDVANQQAPADAADQGVFDEDLLVELGAAIGDEQVDGLLDLLERDILQRRPRIAVLGANNAFDALHKELHSLRGAAASIGAVRLDQAIVALEGVDGEDCEAVSRALSGFGAAVEATLADIHQRRGRPLLRAG